jgi:hypothetical protein
MISMTAIMRSGYHVLRMFPLLLLPLQLIGHKRRAANAFEDQLLQSGLSPYIARELAGAYKKANEDLMRTFRSPSTWT